MAVDFGAKADRTDARDAAARYANKRAEMWGFMKEWLKGSLPDDNELLADLKAVDYGCDASDAILLRRKRAVFCDSTLVDRQRAAWRVVRSVSLCRGSGVSWYSCSTRRSRRGRVGARRH